MALEKVVEIDQIEVKGEYAIQVRQATKVLDDGKQIGGVSYHRHVVNPSMNWSGEDAKVKKIADALFDADCIEAYFVSQNGHPSGEPASGWTVAQLQKYLSNNGVSYAEDDAKSALLTSAKAKYAE